MKKALSTFGVIVFLFVLLKSAAFADSLITVKTNLSTATVGEEITVSGTAPASTFISIMGLDESGSILYFNAVQSDASGAYSDTFKLPESSDGKITFVAGSGSNTASADMKIYTAYYNSSSSSSSSSPVTVTFDKTALAVIKAATGGNYSVVAKKADVSGIADSERAKIGSRPVYELSVKSGGTTISDFGGGKATVSIPYTLADGEDANKIVIYYVSSSGKLVAVPNCVYNASAKTVNFTAKHFSTYAVGYNDVSFKDVSGWYTDYVSYLAARGIISGTGDGNFSPDANITRAQFVTVLARVSGDDFSGYASSEFSDVSTTDWFFKSVQWAYEKGVATGSDGKFNPNASITRQDIAVMLARYADKVAGYTLPETNSVAAFTDSAQISAYASNAVTAMQQAGIISGNGNGSFAPAANATRAQAAKTIAVLLQSMIGG